MPVSRNTRSERQRVAASVAVSADAPATGGASGVALGVVSSGAPDGRPTKTSPSHARFVPADRLGGGRSLRGHDGLRFVRIVLLRRGRAGAARFVIRRATQGGAAPRRARLGRPEDLRRGDRACAGERALSARRSRGETRRAGDCASRRDRHPRRPTASPRPTARRAASASRSPRL